MIRSRVERKIRGRPSAARWLVGVTGLLLVANYLGLVPSPVGTLVPALNADAAMLFGLLAGAGLGSWLWRADAADRERPPRDEVTGLYTPSQADAVAGRLIDRDAREGPSRLALVIIELDDGASIQRRYGESAMAGLLRMVGEALGSECRAADIPFRYADHMLGVYLHCGDLEQAQAFGRRIRTLLASQQLDWQGDVLKPSIRMVIAMHHTGQDLADLQAEGSKALERARADARDPYLR